MRNSTQFSDAIHIMAYIAIYNKSQNNLTSKSIAESVQTNPSNVRKIMSILSHSGLVTSSKGVSKPSIAKSLDQISLYDIYVSLGINNDEIFKIDQQTENSCIVGGNIQQVLSDEYRQLQKIIEHHMKCRSLETIVDKIIVLDRHKKN